MLIEEFAWVHSTSEIGCHLRIASDQKLQPSGELSII